MSKVVLNPRLAPPFPKAALPVLRNPQLRKNVAHATDVIQAKRARLVAEKTDWQDLRNSAAAIKDGTLANLGAYLEEFEDRCTAAGGVVHWAWNATEACKIIIDILRGEQASQVIKIKSMTAAEIDLNSALAAADIEAIETDLAELILQLARISHELGIEWGE
jgi:L-lactate dehydrogenase complex protein LldF